MCQLISTEKISLINITHHYYTDIHFIV